MMTEVFSQRMDVFEALAFWRPAALVQTNTKPNRAFIRINALQPCSD